MEQHDLKYKIALTLLHGIGPRKAALMVARMGSPEAVFNGTISALHKETGISKRLLATLKRQEALEIAERQTEYIARNSIRTHFFLDSDYPRRLKHIPDAPIMLYSKGSFNNNPSRVIAVVGTRNATGYGKALCQQLIEQLREADVQVVSGMAYGIDICAHNACIKNDIQTIGVLGHGLDRVYPSVHRKSAEAMLNNGGLLTEFLPGTSPDRENFPMRNRIVAGMSDATVVIESKATGGSLITAELAFDYNREVYAFPGNVGQLYSEGCNMLIARQKAQLILNGKELIQHMGWELNQHKVAATPSIFKELSEEERKVVEYLENDAAHVDMIALHLKLPVSKISLLLLGMEMKGVLHNKAGNVYSVVQ